MSRELQDTNIDMYEKVPYLGGTFRYSQPDNIATVATLMGMAPAPLTDCRVLELGCAFGKNLIPMAELFPNATFVGVDLTPRHIDGFRESVKQLGLKNVEPRRMSIVDVDESLGQFDYILCHGVYSWVPPSVQDAILRVCSENLKPEGLAYISYNTYPGWHLRETIRHAMLYHTSSIAAPGKQLEQANAILRFLVESVQKLPDDPYALLLQRELKLLQNKPDAYLMHEHLEKENHPCYFHQFMERASQHRLRFLSEAQMSASSVDTVDAAIRETLKKVASNYLQMEQYMDFVRNRQFRMSLLCHQSAQVRRNIDPAAVHDLYVAVRLTSQSAEKKKKLAFETPEGSKNTTTSAAAKAALIHLSEIWPRSILFRDLLRHVQEVVGASEVPEVELSRMFLKSSLNRGVLLSVMPDAFVVGISDQPTVAPSSRLAAARGEAIINRRFERVELNQLDRKLMPKLDGDCDRNQLVAFLRNEGAAGRLEIRLDGELMEPDFWKTDKRSEQYAEVIVDQHLTRLSKNALLTA